MVVFGIAYPLQIKEGNLLTHTDTNYQLTLDHITSVIETEVGERLGLYDFGIPDLTFTSYPVFESVGSLFVEKLTQYVSEANFQAKSYLDETGSGTVEIYWSVKKELDSAQQFISIKL